MTFYRKTAAAMILAAGTAFFSQTVQAGIPKGGLGAITVSHDGNTVYAAGDNRVLYVLDAKDLSVKQRIWIGLNPYEMILSKDGKTLVLHDSSGLLNFLDAETFKSKKTVEKAETIAIAHDAGTIVAAARGRGKGDKASTDYAVYEIATGKQVLKGKFAANIESVGVAQDGSKVFGMTRTINSDDEPKAKPDKSLKGLERDTFVQQNDGKVSHVVTLDGQGKELSRFTTWAAAGGSPMIKPTATEVKVVNYSNKNLNMSFDGSAVELFKTEAFGHYGYAFSNDGSLLVSGGLRKGAITNFSNGASISFEMTKIGGWPEYFEGFAIGPKGNIYGGTSAYRLLKLSPDGIVQAEVPIF